MGESLTSWGLGVSGLRGLAVRTTPRPRNLETPQPLFGPRDTLPPMMTFLLIPLFAAAAALPPARFADPDRAKKLAAAFPEIEKQFAQFVEKQHIPGAVIGIIVDGNLVWLKTA